MGVQSFNSSYTKQFRQEHTVFFRDEEMPSPNLLVRRFGMNETETRFLSESLSPQLHDEALVHHLRSKLNNKDIPATERLQDFVKYIIGELSVQMNAEPYTSHYYDHLMELLNAFLELVDEFMLNGSEYFANTVDLSFGSEEVRNMYGVIENYMYRVGEFFQYFHMLLQKEIENSDDNARVSVMSHMAFYLDTLISYTEKLIINTESTLDILTTWETALLNREAQELYN